MSDLLRRLRAALAARYRVERAIGRGGMGTVFLADDLRHHRQVAIKVLHPELAESLGAGRFLREIEIAARLTHPHIVPLHDSGSVDGLLFYVMPYLGGESLRERLAREVQLPLGDAVAIVRDVADALGQAHGQGVVHRDVKPENILLQAGHALVSDFGVARAIWAAADEVSTQPGLAIGTPAYMSPEQAGGGTTPDGRSDLYALGCVLYEMLAGIPPFTGPTPQSIVARHLADPPPALRVVRPTVPAALEAAIEKALAKVPADRFATVSEFAEAVVAGAASRPGRRHWPSAALAAGALALGAAAYLAVQAASRLQPPAAGAVPAPSSIAVLYFDDRSEGRRLEHLAAGLTEDLIDQLGRVGALRVISPDGVRPYRGRDVSPDSLARAFRVGTLVSGSVSQAGDRVRVTVRLTDASSGVMLSSESFEQPLGGLLALRDSLTGEVARQLRVRVGEAVELRERRATTKVAAAWDLLLRAEDLRRQTERLLLQDSLAARALYQDGDSLLRAAEHLDPGWLEPVVLRGWLAYDQAGWGFESVDSGGVPRGAAPRQWIARGIGYADRALQSDPRLPAALELRGALRYRGWAMETVAGVRDTGGELAQAERDLRAAASAPGANRARAMSTLSSVLQFAGKLVDANLAARQAYEADSYLADADAILLRLFDTSLELGRHDEAQAWCDRGRRTFPGNWRFSMCQLSLLAWSPNARPAPTRAWAILARLDSLASPDERPWLIPQMTMIVAAAVAAAGLPDSADRVIARVKAAGASDPDLLYYEALARVRMGQRSAAARLLAELEQRMPNYGPYLRSHPAFGGLLPGAGPSPTATDPGPGPRPG